MKKLLVLVCLFVASRGWSQPTAFTYQGQLSDSGAPANGAFRMRFGLWDSPAAGNLVGNALAFTNVPVTNGLFTLSLDFGASALDGAPRWLEISVAPASGPPPTTPLAPRQALNSSPYAIQSLSAQSAATASVATNLAGGLPAANLLGTIPDGLLSANVAMLAGGKLPDSDLSSNVPLLSAGKLPDSLLSTNIPLLVGGKLPDAALSSNVALLNGNANFGGTVTAAGFSGNGAGLTNIQASPPAGSVVLSSDPASADLANQGYDKIGTLEVPCWKSLNPYSGFRTAHSAVWTGTEMLIWGGLAAGNGVTTADTWNTGARYRPASNLWVTMNNSGVPTARSGPVALWTGTEMIIWGGSTNTGARYNPSTDTWTAMSVSGVPSGVAVNSAVWTGTQMVIWGGANGSATYNTGARYTPSNNTWTAIATAGAPSARKTQATVWTGTEMIVWGGNTPTGGYTNDGAIYNPASNTWRRMTTNSLPTVRSGTVAIWTGSDMIIWGGQTVGGGYLNDMARYNLSTDTWTPLTATNTPAFRHGSYVWTGTEFIIWGGIDLVSLQPLRDGARFNPATATWTPTELQGAPAPHGGNSAVWTGTSMILYGGNAIFNSTGGIAMANDTYSYTPSAKGPMSIYLKH